jgi:MFS family permease
LTSATGRKAALLLVACLTVMAAATIAPALPRMADAYRGVAGVELLTKLVLTAPALAIALCAPLAGAIIDRFGRLTLLTGSLVLYGVAGAAGYVLHDLHAILASRFVLGVAIAGTMTTTTALAGDYFSGEARARFAALQSFAMSLGAVASVGLGGVLADVDWRLPFLIYLGGWVALVPALAFLSEPPHASERAAHPGDAQRVAAGRVATAYAITLFAVVMYYMTPAQLPFLVRAIGTDSSTAAGAAIAVSSLAAAAGSAAFPRMRRFNGTLGVYVWAFAAMALGYALIGTAGAYWPVVAGTVASGFGVGLFFPNSSLWVLALAPPRLRGRIVGGLTATIFLGQFLSPLVLEPVVAASSLAGAFVVAAAAMALVSAALFLVRRRRW